MRYRILLGVPGSGTLSEGAAQASYLSSLHHDVDRIPSCVSGPNFNRIWIQGLRQAGKYSHLAIVCADITVLEQEPGYRWLDLALQETDAHNADFLSVATAIKDERCLVSCGIGNPDNRWNCWRRFTTEEIRNKLPTTFTAADVGYPDKFLLHNQHLCVWDLRKPLWFRTGLDGRCRCVFNFTEDIRLVNGQWELFMESEDWAFSRQLWQMKARTVITSRIETVHPGTLHFSNREPCGTYQNGDADTQSQWLPELEPV